MSDTRPNQNKAPKQYIILDTCIIQFLLTKDLSKEIEAILLKSIEKGFGLALSSISILESIENASESKEKEILDAMNKFPIYDLDSNTLIATGRLRTLYSKDKNIYLEKISVGDSIIAATAILTNSLIATANYNDYPRPFFVEKYKKAVFYKQKDKERLMPIFILKPKISIVNFRFSERPKS